CDWSSDVCSSDLLLEQSERTQADVIRGFERGERFVTVAEREQVAGAFDLDHRFRRARKTRPLKRSERSVVTTELPFRLRDAQPAQPVLGARRENRAVSEDCGVPQLLSAGERRG